MSIALGILLVLLVAIDGGYAMLIGRQMKAKMVQRRYGPYGIIVGAEPYQYHSAGAVGCLLIHGYCDSPLTMTFIAQALRQQGYGYRAMLLPGHGTTPEQLANKTWQDWLTACRKEYRRLRQRYAKVFVIGFSTGATLALRLAETGDLPGIICLAPFLRCPRQLKLVRPETTLRLLSHIMFFTRYLKKVHSPGISDRQILKRFIHYEYLPVDSALSLFELAAITRRDISKIKAPILILHGGKDHTAAPEASQLDLYDKLTSLDKRLRYFANSQHVLCMDIEREQVITEIIQTLTRWTGQ